MHALTKHGLDLKGADILNVDEETSVLGPVPHSSQLKRNNQTNNISSEILTPDIWSDPEIEEEDEILL